MAGGGRKKTELKLIERKDSRLVCFSKRRSGLFKKARELSILSGAQIGALVFSPAGKPFVSDVAAMDSLLGLEKRCEIYDAVEVNEPPFWWDVPLQGMGCEELLQLERRMLEYGEKKMSGFQQMDC
ncbi:agamous-like MADS-box protein AGL29 [Phalaenopsis equestris]|uniref:agamous-like MADS-box protein AGL29 n=1 Tax=Phalaenopsis equestris TaxID=78828 RepID=UPI0009E54167|nr:agamous-like MADS-box protein AGL29 [Phalaenopsis equestris]